MLGDQYSVFCNDFRKFREPPLEGLLLKNSRNCEGANESLSFFVWYFSAGGYGEYGNLFINKSRIYKE